MVKRFAKIRHTLYKKQACVGDVSQFLRSKGKSSSGLQLYPMINFLETTFYLSPPWKYL